MLFKDATDQILVITLFQQKITFTIHMRSAREGRYRTVRCLSIRFLLSNCCIISMMTTPSAVALCSTVVYKESLQVRSVPY